MGFSKTKHAGILEGKSVMFLIWYSANISKLDFLYNRRYYNSHRGSIWDRLRIHFGAIRRADQKYQPLFL